MPPVVVAGGGTQKGDVSVMDVIRSWRASLSLPLPVPVVLPATDGPVGRVRAEVLRVTDSLPFGSGPHVSLEGPGVRDDDSLSGDRCVYRVGRLTSCPSRLDVLPEEDRRVVWDTARAVGRMTETARRMGV